jgi:hypothetical protein
MPRRRPADDEDNADGDEPMVNCPYCRRLIYEEAERCPYCEQYISEEDAPASWPRWWIILGVVLGLYAVCRWILVWWGV